MILYKIFKKVQNIVRIQQIFQMQKSCSLKFASEAKEGKSSKDNFIHQMISTLTAHLYDLFATFTLFILELWMNKVSF